LYVACSWGFAAVAVAACCSLKVFCSFDFATVFSSWVCVSFLEAFQLLLESCTVLVGYKVLIHPKKEEDKSNVSAEYGRTLLYQFLRRPR